MIHHYDDRTHFQKQTRNLNWNKLSCWSPVTISYIQAEYIYTVCDTVPFFNDILLYIQWNHTLKHTIILLIFRKIFFLSLSLSACLKETQYTGWTDKVFPPLHQWTICEIFWFRFWTSLSKSTQNEGVNDKSPFLRHVLGVVKSFYPLARIRCLHTKTKVHLAYPSPCLLHVFASRFNYVHLKTAIAIKRSAMFVHKDAITWLDPFLSDCPALAMPPPEI